MKGFIEVPYGDQTILLSVKSIVYVKPIDDNNSVIYTDNAVFMRDQYFNTKLSYRSIVKMIEAAQEK